MKKRVLILMLALALCAGMSLTAAGRGDSGAAAEKVTITHITSWVGENPFAGYFSAQLEGFKNLYGSTVTLAIENVPGHGAEFYEKMKVLLSAGALPDVWMTDSVDFAENAIRAGLVTDLRPYLEADPEWYGALNQYHLDFWSKNIGGGDAIYGISSHQDMVGYYYNKEMFQKAGISAPAKTWDEFLRQLDALKAAGFAPLSMMTAEGGWIADIWLLALVGTAGEAGQQWATSLYPDNWSIPEVISGLEMLKTFFQDYATTDAVSLRYADAANYFLNEETAIIANGPWMIGDFKDPDKAVPGFYDKVGTAIFPGGATLQRPGYAFYCSATDPKKIDAVVRFIKYLSDDNGQLEKLKMMNLSPASPNLDISSVPMDPLFADLLEMGKGTIPVGWPWFTIPEGLTGPVSQQLATLVLDRATPAQVADTLTQEIRKIK